MKTIFFYRAPVNFPCWEDSCIMCRGPELEFVSEPCLYFVYICMLAFGISRFQMCCILLCVLLARAKTPRVCLECDALLEPNEFGSLYIYTIYVCACI